MQPRVNGKFGSLPIMFRMEAKIVKGPECWEWSGHRSTRGYGRIWYNGRLRLAHRVYYELVRGAIPKNHELDHLCRNPPCVNPDHLEPVSHSLNMVRGYEYKKYKEQLIIDFIEEAVPKLLDKYPEDVVTDIKSTLLDLRKQT